MNIQEATKKAMETNKNIQRDSIGIKIKPTNSMDCCLLFHPSKKRMQTTMESESRRFNS